MIPVSKGGWVDRDKNGKAQAVLECGAGFVSKSAAKRAVRLSKNLHRADLYQHTPSLLFCMEILGYFFRLRGSFALPIALLNILKTEKFHRAQYSGSEPPLFHSAIARRWLFIHR